MIFRRNNFVATVVVNRPDHLEFKNIQTAAKLDDAPTVLFQAGDWDAGGHTETGVVIDVSGAQLPLLAAADARRLAKWLNRAADFLDGGNKSEKKQKYRPRPDYDDDESF
jgi:hypothetical protein